MRKLTLIFFIIIALAGTLHAGSFKTIHDADDVKVEISMDSDPPVKGQNNINIVLHDSKGMLITNAQVRVIYNMKPMGNMPTMSYMAKAKFDGENYMAVTNFAMSGHWDVKINIKRPEKTVTHTTLSLKVP